MMKSQVQKKHFAASMILSAMVMVMMFVGCKKKNPTEPEPGNSAPTRTRTSTATPTIVGGFTATPTATAVGATATATVSATSCAPAPQLVVNLGTAGSYAVLSKSGISTTGTTSIVGDLGVSPIDSTGITGFGLIMDASNTFSTSSLVTGNVYAADYTPPTPAQMTAAISDMEIAFTDAAGRTCPNATELGAGDISGLTITPGLYKWGTGVLITTGVTLTGSSTDVIIFQIAQDLTVANGAMVTLSGGLLPRNVFWQVSGQAILGTTADFKGVILCQTLVDMQTGAVLNGRALAQTAVTLDAASITESN